MSDTTVILITLIVYKVVLIGFGLVGQRRTRDSVDFFLGGRRLGPVVAALSASASSSSAWTLIGVSSAAYLKGLSAIWIFPGCVGGFILNWYGLAPGLQRLGRRTGAVTATDIIAGPKGDSRRRAAVIIAACITLFCLGTYVASQFKGAGKTFAGSFELRETESILIGSGIVVLYTLLGGFWAVSFTDCLQGIMMALAAIVIPVVAVVHVGGPAALWEGIQTVDGGGDYAAWWLDGPFFGGIGFVLGYLGIGIGYPGQPHVVNRFMALEEGEGAITRARRVAVGWAVIIYAGMLITGWAGRIIIPALGDAENVLVALMRVLFSPVVAGVILAAILSAIMSTADSQLLVAASSISHDLEVGKIEGRELLVRSRLAVLGISALAVLAALFVQETIFNWVLFAWSAMGCAFGPLLLVAAWRGRAVPSRYAIPAMLCGFTLSVLAYLGPQMHASITTKGGIVDRVLPFVVALAIALAGAKASSRTAD